MSLNVCEQRSNMILRANEIFEIERKHRFLTVRFKAPQRVLTTSAMFGGERTDLLQILNCQTCEANAHHERAKSLHLLSLQAMHDEACLEAKCESATTALLGTAANMDYAAVQEAEYEDAKVTAIVTAGVQGNAVRTGDAATWHEGEKGYLPVHAVPGTINIIVLFHQSLSSAALARAVVTLTEAKSRALQDLAIPSRYSTGLATGTGTDQFAIAAPFSETPRFHWTGQHAKLGELVGSAVHKAVLEALRWQNGLEPSITRRLSHALGRYGVKQDQLSAQLSAQASNEEERKFLLESLAMIEHDPKVSAVAYAIASVLDRELAGVLPHESALESVRHQCALLSTHLSAKPERLCDYLRLLEPLDGQVAAQLSHAIILGWRDKWN